MSRFVLTMFTGVVAVVAAAPPQASNALISVPDQNVAVPAVPSGIPPGGPMAE
jgi:hypothetical protein